MKRPATPKKVRITFPQTGPARRHWGLSRMCPHLETDPCPSQDYASIVEPATYVRARALSRQAVNGWLESVAQAAPNRKVRVILDLGCGTGRFSQALAQRFQAAVFGVDPSPAMLAQARRAAPESVVFCPGRAECIPLPDRQADLVFLSQCWHYLDDEVRAAREMLRVLAPGGRACIRNSTIENLRTYLYLRFFPGARETYRRRMPQRKRIVSVMKRAGFQLVRLRVVRQVIARNRPAYLNRIRQRASSDLAKLTSEEFALGLDRLARYCRSPDQDQPVTEQMDLLTFSRP